ncbi:hypothetical protein ATCC90586_008106 [Pythium insidiosum]|nr:hypothetical protein ATCC90586_008106 [Pythium insidiosum]
MRTSAPSVALAAVALASAVASAHECSSTCGTPSGLEFCSQVSWAVCGGDASWEDLDATAHASFQAWTNASDTKLKLLPQYADKDSAALEGVLKSLDLANLSSPCGHLLQRLQCAVHLPVCEIGRDFTRLCQNSCKENVKKTCPGLENICGVFSSNDVEAKGKCFKLEYSGPAVGMWVAGFTISLVFSILNSIGINLQKLSMSRNEAAEVKRGTFHQPLWVLGFGLVVLGSLLDFVAFGMAPQTLLAPLAALSLVWNMFIAPIFHKETVTRENIIATVIIFVGVTLTVIFAGHSTPEYELDDLIRLYKQPAMYAYMVLITLFLTGLLMFARHIERTHVFEGGLYHIICYGGVAGTFGGQSVLLAKSTVELLKSAIWGNGGSAVFTRPAPYFIVFGLFLCLACQVHFLNGGLARFDALIVIPVYQSFWILMSVLGGIMYFEEYVSMTKTQMFMFTVGGSITILGIVFLLKTRREGGAGESGRYVELSVTPSSAWAADDSDEEEVIQLKTHNKFADDSDSSKAKATSVSPPTSVSPTGSKSARSDNVSAAIYRSPTSPKSPTSNSSRATDDEDDFI